MVQHSPRRTKPDLSEFLTRHRKKLTPADVGLPSTGYRRTPGLRREEVAALAGVGLTWYTWFEQGRDIQVSERFLLSVSKALRLNDAECCHLFLLAHKRPPPLEAQQWVTVTPLIQQMMDDLHERPAYVLNLRWDVIAWNATADQVFGFSHRPREQCNFLHLVFADPEMRQRLPDWNNDAACLLAQFRADVAAVPEDPSMLALVQTLKALSPDFRRWWQSMDSPQARRGISAYRTEGAPQAVAYETLVVDEYRHLRMVVYFMDGAGA